MKILCMLALSLSLIGCAKKETTGDDPSAPVLSFYKAEMTGDSAGIVNCFTSAIRQSMISTTDSTHAVRRNIEHWNGTHAEVTIQRIDSIFPAMMKVYYKAKLTGKEDRTMDSVFLYVAKEEGKWKLAALQPGKDR